MSYTKNRDIRSFPAAAAIGGYKIVAASGTDNQIRTAAAATDSLVGVGERVGSESGEMADVTVAGETEVLAGGPIAFNDPITADAQGRAIKAVVTSAAAVRTIGFLRSPAAVLGDIVRIHVAPGFLTKPAA